jgi:hypothetical protein
MYPKQSRQIRPGNTLYAHCSRLMTFFKSIPIFNEIQELLIANLIPLCSAFTPQVFSENLD